MRKVFTKIYPLLLVPVLAACVQIKDKSKGEDILPPDHSVEAMATPNVFRVHLSRAEGASEIRRQNLSEAQINATAVTLDSSIDSGLVDSQVKPGEKYRYEYLSSSGNILKIVEVEIPQDLVIDHEVSLTQSPSWQNIYRVFFLNGGTLTTNGYNVLLKAQVIDSDHGRIRTFADQATAATETDGKSGGIIRIFTKNASGDLAVELRGENGGAGSATGGVRNGDAGSGGDAGKLYLDSQSTNGLRVTHMIQAGAGGIGAKAIAGSSICIMGGCHAGEFLTTPGRKAGHNGADGQVGEICFSQVGRILSCEQ